MAVQQNRKTPSKRNMRRAHDALGFKTISTEKSSGERHLRHHVSKSGIYRGRQIVLPNKQDEEIEVED